MRKAIWPIITVICIAFLLFSFFFNKGTGNYNDCNNVAALEENIGKIAEMRFSIVTTKYLISASNGYNTSYTENDVKLALEGNILFTADAFEKNSALSSEISTAIYAGNVVAVYDPNGIDTTVGDLLSLPLIPFDEAGGNNDVAGSELHSENLLIGRFFGTDGEGHIRIFDVSVPHEFNEYSIFEIYCQRLVAFFEEAGKPRL